MTEDTLVCECGHHTDGPKDYARTEMTKHFKQTGCRAATNARLDFHTVDHTEETLAVLRREMRKRLADTGYINPTT